MGSEMCIRDSYYTVLISDWVNSDNLLKTRAATKNAITVISDLLTSLDKASLSVEHEELLLLAKKEELIERLGQFQ